jgi:hypothetical protein
MKSTFAFGIKCFKTTTMSKCQALQIRRVVGKPSTAFDVLTESETSGRPHRRRRLQQNSGRAFTFHKAGRGSQRADAWNNRFRRIVFVNVKRLMFNSSL